VEKIVGDETVDFESFKKEQEGGEFPVLPPTPKPSRGWLFS
jgi:hypothetical protein